MYTSVLYLLCVGSLKLHRVGRLMPHTEAKVVSTDRTKVLPVGQRGELAVSGYHLQRGYWNDLIGTAEVMTKDWNGKLWMHKSDFPRHLYCLFSSVIRLINRTD
ncbi:unnamed protein product [Tuber melanosporum]|uniref:(Perigord truffle) hypothetical protein n=1 Tax=Tuber melanosporum (strain Mel28) TaxID=656061 RepID=D5GM09_TUBMM|nr:uncharacterized protein GSTUM_00010352001 [Tuber melanosporum]CAZ85471.1 unnamed protein product [Tuber melanosporum]